MALFFFLVGLEIKAEVLEGQLASVRQALVPAGAALGGMLVPALIYILINLGNPPALHGWAIPTATDIAFSLGVLQLMGTRVPLSLKVFLTAVAVIDDLGAIIVIAVFYGHQLSPLMLWAAALGAAVLASINRLGVVKVMPYALVGAVVWLFMLKSGIHATLAGVVAALAVPMHRPDGSSPVHEAEHLLKPWVTFLILPGFAFVNAGVSLAGVGASTLFGSVPLGIMLGLVVGKTVGVYGGAQVVMRLTGAGLPAGSSRAQFLAVCVLCGIGFTMSLFIGSLAFETLDADYHRQLRIGVLLGSALSASLGVWLRLRASRQT
jgi:NhaA family Na+:H+ antiporter